MPSDTETCRSAILSEDVRDFIGNDVRTAFFDGISGQTLCSQDAGFGYSCLYLPAAAADPITLSRYSYDSIPKCYAPADMQTLNQAGILPVQNYPTLQLRGRGVLVGFMDSGIDYQSQLLPLSGRHYPHRSDLGPDRADRSAAAGLLLWQRVHPGNDR